MSLFNIFSNHFYIIQLFSFHSSSHYQHRADLVALLNLRYRLVKHTLYFTTKLIPNSRSFALALYLKRASDFTLDLISHFIHYLYHLLRQLVVLVQVLVVAEDAVNVADLYCLLGGVDLGAALFHEDFVEA